MASLFRWPRRQVDAAEDFRPHESRKHGKCIVTLVAQYVVRVLSLTFIGGQISAQKMSHDVYVDKNGVMRRGNNKEELHGFGINYTAMFAHAYRATKKTIFYWRKQLAMIFITLRAAVLIFSGSMFGIQRSVTAWASGEN